MNMLTKVMRNASDTAERSYHRVLPKPAKEYAMAGLSGFSKLIEDLAVNVVSAISVIPKSFASGIPAGLRSFGHAIKAIFFGLPKTAYYKYQAQELDEEDAYGTALRETREDFSKAGNQLMEAASISVVSAEAGFKPLMSNVANSLDKNGREVVRAAGALAAIAGVEGVKLTANQIVFPAAGYLADKMANVISTCAQVMPDPYKGLSKVEAPALLPGFARRRSGNRMASKLSSEERAKLPSVMAASAALFH